MIVYHICPQKYYDYQTQTGVFEVWDGWFDEPEYSHLKETKISVGIWCAKTINDTIYGSQHTKDTGCLLLKIDADEEKLDPCEIGGKDYFFYRTTYINLCDIKNMGWVCGRSNEYFAKVA